MSETERPTIAKETKTNPISQWEVTSVSVAEKSAPGGKNADRMITVIFPGQQMTQQDAAREPAPQPSL